jgi:16S rRNA (guanine527-N7)-methyltransferase
VSDRGAVIDRLGVSRETSDRLVALADLLRRWNARINLVAPRTIDDLWRRHIEDSAQLHTLAPDTAKTWIDLGSGAGFPGLVVAAMAADKGRPLEMTMVDSDSRKCAFLREAAREMALEVDVRTERVERMRPEPHDVISARALASLDRLIDLSNRFTATSTVRLFPKGASAACELTEAEKHWHIECRSHPSVTDRRAVILEIREVSRGHVLRS